MHKPEMINTISEKTSMTKKDVSLIVDSVFDTITEALLQKEDVAIHGFGTFKPKTRAARNGVNPKTKEKIQIPACETVSFKLAAALKSSLN